MTQLVIIGLIMMYGIGLLPAVIIRFVFMKRPILYKWKAWGVAFLLYVFDVCIFTALVGHTVHLGIHGIIFLMIPYFILRKGINNYEKEEIIELTECID